MDTQPILTAGTGNGSAAICQARQSDGVRGTDAWARLLRPSAAYSDNITLVSQYSRDVNRLNAARRTRSERIAFSWLRR